MKRVIVGVSGGVDSSVAVVLLKNEGYEVVGVTFKFTKDFDDTDAKIVCEKLGIEHHVVDYRKEFKKEVIDKFIEDYKRGITPNPCVMCNKNVKLNFLYENMIKYNCDYMATGHYAKIEEGILSKSVDLNKDQTYFLCEVPKKMLSKILFPLEGIDKAEVRKIALENGLVNANKKDSTDVCFINSNFKEYIESNIIKNPGDVIDVKTNKKVGTHKGLSYYTIGQRRGLDIGGTKERMFVVGKDLDKNILYIATGNDNEYLVSDSCLVDSVNWIYNEKVTCCTAKFRYSQAETEVELVWLENDKLLVKYPQGVKSVTPGQVCTLYLGEICLGGGIIEEVRKDGKKLWYL